MSKLGDIECTSQSLRERFASLQIELERAAAEEQTSFAFCARCRTLCHQTEAAFESNGDAPTLQAWKEAESEWVRAREAHSDAHVRKTTLKIQLEALRYQLRRLSADEQL